MKILRSIAAAAGLVAVAGMAHGQNATREEAIALVKKAVAHVKAKGVEQACVDFADPQGGFIQGELYVFVQDMNTKMVCHGVNKRLNGKDMSELKDVDGKYFTRAMTELAKTKGSGWVDYQWPNPTTKALEPKSSYVEKVNDTIFLGAGIYRK
ncbi:cache domain-containing protein [Pseudoduganella namucuonensis]|uniref:Single Cache domain 2-containing protein n=1 Tax=Pseudoduganella namucuonensis TaxID=1035707 RepID=A0A1I7L716_9BURK|nr:cache domain-containing protein [Pseudoduganella namucuonensis]SFV05529.1 Single Cache domain 2-containing protein [Pseudoduganella namucuonensis]